MKKQSLVMIQHPLLSLKLGRILILIDGTTFIFEINTLASDDSKVLPRGILNLSRHVFIVSVHIDCTKFYICLNARMTRYVDKEMVMFENRSEC